MLCVCCSTCSVRVRVTTLPHTLQPCSRSLALLSLLIREDGTWTGSKREKWKNIYLFFYTFTHPYVFSILFASIFIMCFSNDDVFITCNTFEWIKTCVLVYCLIKWWKFHLHFLESFFYCLDTRIFYIGLKLLFLAWFITKSLLLNTFPYIR